MGASLPRRAELLVRAGGAVEHDLGFVDAVSLEQVCAPARRCNGQVAAALDAPIRPPRSRSHAWRTKEAAPAFRPGGRHSPFNGRSERQNVGRIVRPVSSLDEFREERAIQAKERFDEAWSNREQNWRALELALDELDVTVCALVSARDGADLATRPGRDEFDAG